MPETDAQRALALAVSEALLRKPVPLDRGRIVGQNARTTTCDISMEPGMASVMKTANDAGEEQQHGDREVSMALKWKNIIRPAFLELKTYLAKNLTGFKIPKQIVVVEKLPTTATGKVQKRLLVEMLQGQNTTENANEKVSGDSPRSRL